MSGGGSAEDPTTKKGRLSSLVVAGILFVVGFFGVAAVLVSYWSIADSSPNEGWRRIVIFVASFVGGFLSARYGKKFWSAFVHSL